MSRCSNCNYESKIDMLICPQCGLVLGNKAPVGVIKGVKTTGNRCLVD